MHWSSMLGAAVWLVTAHASLAHEKRENPLCTVRKRDVNRWPVEADALLPMRIGLRSNQNAIANATQWIRDVSDPDSANYGKHWTQEEVIDAFKPSDETVSRVQQWLSSHDITPTHSDNKLWFAFDLPASEAGKLFKAEYFEHMNSKGQFAISSDEYHIPDDLKGHIDVVKPGLVSSVVTGRTKRSRDWLDKKLRTALQARSVELAEAKKPKTIPPPFPANDLKNCDIAVSPACIRALYNFTVPDPKQSVSKNNSMGLFESFSLARQQDLNSFWAYYTTIPKGTGPIFKSIDGAVTSVQKAQSFNYSGIFPFDEIVLGEATGDYEFAFPIIYPQTVTTFQEDDPYWAYYGNFYRSKWIFGDMLDAIDGSYCKNSLLGSSFPNGTYPTYPDPRAHGYKGKLQCGVFKAPNVPSLSYELNEIPEQPIEYLDRQCTEYMKLGLQGTVFNTPWPGTCPWVTTVGATEIKRGNSVSDPEVSTPWSGGGFSLLYDRPWYQKTAVDTYFQKYDPKEIPYFTGRVWQNKTGRYNRDGRGYPDVAAVGKALDDIQSGNFSRFAGTSASTPIVAALFNRIVEERIRHGKGPVGFVNPVLYKNPHVLNDIVVGNNSLYCSQGFSCEPGWDPVTGLGTPRYADMLDLFVSLP